MLRRIANLLRDRVVVLLYHRVAELDNDPQLLCVSLTNFARQMECLSRHYKPISLQALEDALFSGEVPDNAVVVTFDDGYADNLWNAKPILECYNIPATIFVSTGYVDLDRELSSDILENCLLQPRRLPNILKLDIRGKSYSWQINELRNNVEAWNVTTRDFPTSRHRCYYELHRLLRPLNDRHRREALESLADWASCHTSARPDRRVLNSDEIKILAKDDLIEIGAHGVSHLVMGEQPLDAQWKEISNSKQYLEGSLNKSVTKFSYPYGGPGDVTGETIKLVQKAGFKLACANVPESVTRRSNLFFLPRFLVRNWVGIEFTSRLRKYFNG